VPELSTPELPEPLPLPELALPELALPEPLLAEPLLPELATPELPEPPLLPELQLPVGAVGAPPPELAKAPDATPARTATGSAVVISPAASQRDRMYAPSRCWKLINLQDHVSDPAAGRSKLLKRE